MFWTGSFVTNPCASPALKPTVSLSLTPFEILFLPCVPSHKGVFISPPIFKHPLPQIFYLPRDSPSVLSPPPIPKSPPTGVPPFFFPPRRGFSLPVPFPDGFAHTVLSPARFLPPSGGFRFPVLTRPFPTVPDVVSLRGSPCLIFGVPFALTPFQIWKPGFPPSPVSTGFRVRPVPVRSPGLLLIPVRSQSKMSGLVKGNPK